VEDSNKIIKIILLFIVISGLTILNIGESAEISTTLPQMQEQCKLNKITFDLNSIDKDGFMGPEDGKTSIDYEFCIPNEDQYLKEIQIIDFDIKCYQNATGRSDCRNNEYLCIGNTGFKDYLSILCKLSSLDYIKRIDQNFWE